MFNSDSKVDQAKSKQPAGKEPLSWWRRILRIARRGSLAVLAAIGLYLLVVVLGMIPVNNDFEPSPDGVEIWLISSSVHADIILPIENDVVDWREHLPTESFSGDTSLATHVAVGWGDSGFYIGTPTWNDLKFSTAANALLWPSESCMHVTMMRKDYLPDSAIAVRISKEQYQSLVDYIDDTFAKDLERQNQLISGAAYGRTDAFFRAHSHYHCFNTCNCWVGGGMRSAGIRTGWFTPLPKSMFLWL